MKKYLQLLIFMFVSVGLQAQTSLNYNLEEENVNIDAVNHSMGGIWVLDSTYHYSVDDLDYTIYEKYDVSGNLIATVSRYLDESTNQFEIKRDSTYYTYNGESRATKIVFVWNRYDEEWSDTVKYSIYNDDGKPTRALDRTYDEDRNTFSSGSDTRNIYNTHGNIASSKFVTWDKTLQAWNEEGKEEFIYDGHNYLVKKIVESWDPNLQQYVDNTICNYTNDNSGKVLESKQESWFSQFNIWVEVSNRSYSYDAIGNVWFEFHKKYDEQDFNLVWDKKHWYNFNANNQIKRQTVDTFDVSLNDWVPSTQYQYLYDGNDNLSAKIEQKWDAEIDQWIMNSRFEYFYHYNADWSCSVEYTLNATICDGEVYNLKGTELTESGSYLETILNNQCDTIITLNLQVLPEIELTNSILIQDDGTGNGSIWIEFNDLDDQLNYNWSNGGNSNSIESLVGGEYCCTVSYDLGCEKVFCFDVELVCITENILTSNICHGDTYLFGGVELTESGSYIDTIFNAQCDTVVILDLMVYPEIELTNSVVTNENGTGNGSITIEINNLDGQFTYIWSIPNGGGLNTIDSLIEGEYCCTVTSEVGCDKTFCFNVELETSVGDLSVGDIIVYPNPSYEGTEIQVSYEGNKANFYTNVYNALGQKVYSGKVNNVIDFKFKKGLYLISLERENEKVSKRIIVK